MKIGIIGAGISGLTSALALAKKGHHVEVFHKEREPGGLIGTFDFDGVRIEHYYHFLCAGDSGYFRLCEELGLKDQLRFARARTGFFYDGRSYPLSTPLDLLRFDAIPWTQRLRFGLFALEARWRNEWRQLDEIAAKPWLIDRIGLRAYEVIWEPLLSLKFGAFHEQISAAWVWHRLHRVARSKGRMGYLDGGTQRLLDALIEQLRGLGVAVHLECPVAGVLTDEGGQRAVALRFDAGADFECDRVVSTVPLPVLADLLPAGWDEYANQLRQVHYIGVVCVAFKLKRAVSPYFWYNVHDSRAPFNGIIEYTNLVPLGGSAGHIVYVPYYVPVDHPIYTMTDEAVVRRSWEGLLQVQPRLRDQDILARHVARAPYAQAICPTGFLRMLPEHRSPLDGLYLLDSTFLYPEDRTQSGQILRAYACAESIGP